MGERTPFEGKFHLNDQVTGATAAIDLSNNLKSLTIVIDRTKIAFGAHIGTDHRKEFTGSSSVSIDWVIEDLTQVQIHDFLLLHKNKTLMEVKYMSLTGAAIDSPTTTIMQWDFQFEMPTPPMMAGVTDELVNWTLGGMLVEGFQEDDGATQILYGTLL